MPIDHVLIGGRRSSAISFAVLTDGDRQRCSAPPDSRDGLPAVIEVGRVANNDRLEPI
ncbi:MAG TPA: hypothetical protein VN133_10095 [Humibacter sp.]|nr:hypothetical protein [Humibacter sp.]